MLYHKRYYSIVFLSVVFFCIILFGPSWAPALEKDGGFTFNKESDYWPTNKWKSSPPEKQGMRSLLLTKMFEEINDDHYYISSVMVVRNGYVVAEANRNDTDHMYPIWSTTKSITTGLVGVALKQSILKSINQPVHDFFPKLSWQEDDPQKKNITIKHLLTMTSGFDWPEIESSLAYDGNPEYQMEMSSNWAEYVLNRPMTHRPGETFNYNSGCSILLTAVLQQAGLDVAAFARQHLFLPLGIKTDKYFWNKTSDSMPNGSHGLVMNSRDIAKIGYLYLKGGYWDSKQILPETWVAESVRQQTRMTWKGFVADYYGYGWYLQPFGFHSLGYQGQYIFVLPDLEIVVVFTGELALHELQLPIEWVRKYIIAAAKPAEPLSENIKDVQKLTTEISLFNNTPFW